MNGFAAEYRTALIEAIGKLPLGRIGQAIEWLKQARDEGQTIFACGNGGSASTASHFVCDMVKGASFGREKRFRILALTDSLPTLTAYSNDVGYDVVFVEQLRNFARPGDVLLAISGSGNSPNVLRAVEYANAGGLKTIGLTGRDGGQLGRLSQLEINVPDPHMGRIEDGHLIVCHMLAYYFMDCEGK
jgi:D-sedoheptulose 7-phosphate isomerase